MKVFLSSTYNDLIEQHVIPVGRKATHDAIEPIDLTGFHVVMIQRGDLVKPVRS